MNNRLAKVDNLIIENDYHFSFQNPEEPQLFRDMFDYDSVPKITFNHRVVPMCMPEEIWITDTTFRDGQQSRTPFTVKQIVDLYKMEHKLGGPKGIIRQSEFFVYTQKDREAIQACLDLRHLEQVADRLGDLVNVLTHLSGILLLLGVQIARARQQLDVGQDGSQR
jgi:hypothetical protein